MRVQQNSVAVSLTHFLFKMLLLRDSRAALWQALLSIRTIILR